MASNFACTPIQVEIMTVICEATARGTFLTPNDLMATLSHRPNRKALHCSLKYLKRHGLVETVNHGRNGADVKPTQAGMDLFKPKPIGFP